MSKGSARRPGVPGAYEDGYDRIFGKDPDFVSEVRRRNEQQSRMASDIIRRQENQMKNKPTEKK